MVRQDYSICNKNTRSFCLILHHVTQLSQGIRSCSISTGACGSRMQLRARGPFPLPARSGLGSAQEPPGRGWWHTGRAAWSAGVARTGGCCPAALQSRGHGRVPLPRSPVPRSRSPDWAGEASARAAPVRPPPPCCPRPPREEQMTKINIVEKKPGLQQSVNA